MTEVKTILVLGKPGAGKGTQGAKLVSALGWRSCVTGDHFRELAQTESALGNHIRSELATGRLLPSFFVTRLFVATVMGLEPTDGVVFDGFGRSVRQAKEAQRVLSWFGRPYLAINLHVSDEVAVERMVARSQVQQRIESDTVAKIEQRLRDYHRKSEPALAHFDRFGVLRQVDTTGPTEEAHEAILAYL